MYGSRLLKTREISGERETLKRQGKGGRTKLSFKNVHMILFLVGLLDVRLQRKILFYIFTSIMFFIYS